MYDITGGDCESMLLEELRELRNAGSVTGHAGRVFAGKKAESR